MWRQTRAVCSLAFLLVGLGQALAGQHHDVRLCSGPAVLQACKAKVPPKNRAETQRGP